jgi:hypothetical protein
VVPQAVVVVLLVGSWQGGGSVEQGLSLKPMFLQAGMMLADF